MFGLGPTELIVIAVILLLIFGAKRIPEIGKGLGGAVREFKNVKKELSSRKPGEEDRKSERTSDGDAGNPIEKQLKNKVLERVPVVKKAMDIKKKTEQIKRIIE